jgi:hypothetical protein
MSSGMNFMYGHVFGAHSRKPHIDTVRAIRKSNTDPYITAPFGVDQNVAKPGPRKTPFLEQVPPVPDRTTDDVDDLINMISNDPTLKTDSKR